MIPTAGWKHWGWRRQQPVQDHTENKGSNVAWAKAYVAPTPAPQWFQGGPTASQAEVGPCLHRAGRPALLFASPDWFAKYLPQAKMCPAPQRPNNLIKGQEFCFPLTGWGLLDRCFWDATFSWTSVCNLADASRGRRVLRVWPPQHPGHSNLAYNAVSDALSTEKKNF